MAATEKSPKRKLEKASSRKLLPIPTAKKTVVLGVTGSIAAYKSAELASLLVKQGHEVFVVMTHDAGATYLSGLDATYAMMPDMRRVTAPLVGLDPRFPFTEPEYPTPDIRMGHEGTVWLTIEILPNGRVGAVRIDQTSGFARLDDAAVREARKWRMKPGTQDGIAIAMYKRVPVTFRLKD